LPEKGFFLKIEKTRHRRRHGALAGGRAINALGAAARRWGNVEGVETPGSGAHRQSFMNGSK